ncbi:hypothetical protein McanMca71_000779 [Microsporum canis]|uniref:Uncharacterized protein n=1 Tax=Arthroderma otae (strain ATCC MYA-4605 / CBS 113480) TaxID=554155 RepID=C5FLE3_ARTOC|nr:uncharacterized protein MCYG_03334 [Microsporum canis CBS 113480]EEQ30515.1 predicted protein [Microsporum canis CBS 113480]
MTTVNPYSPLPARIAGSIQLTATTNSALSVFRNVMWPAANSTVYLNDSLNNATLILNDHFEDFINKWDRKFEELRVEIAEPSIPTTTISNPTPTSPVTATNTIWPEFYTTHREYNEWVGYTLYCFVKQEVKRNPNIYTAATIFILVNYWLVLSARRSELVQKRGATKGLSTDGTNEARDQLSAQNARLELLEAKVDGLLFAPATDLTDGQHRLSRNAPGRVPPLNDTRHDIRRAQRISINQSERLEFASLQEQLEVMRQDLVSLKNTSEARSERINFMIDTITEFKKDAQTEKCTNRLEDIASIKKSVSEELKSEIESIRAQITDLEHAAISFREESKKSIADHMSSIIYTINGLQKESERAKRKGQLADLASIKEMSREHKSECELLQEQITDLQHSTSTLKEESEECITKHVSTIISTINELKKDSETAKRMNHAPAIDSVKKDVSNLKHSMKKLEHELDEKRDDARAIDLHKLKASVEALQQDKTGALKEFSIRLDRVGEVLQSQPWMAESETFNQRISNVTSKLQALERSTQTEKSLSFLQSQLESLSTKVDFTETSLKELKGETATKFEHKSLLMEVKHLEGRIQQWETIPQKGPVSVVNEDSVKLRDLGKNYVDLMSQFAEIKDAFASLVSSDIPKQRSEDHNQVTEAIRQSASQLEKKIKSQYAREEDVRKCLNVIQPEGGKPIDLRSLKERLSDIENYAYGTKNDLIMAKERITDSEQHIETLREGNATNYKDIRRCLGKLGLPGSVVSLSEPINPKHVPAESKPPVHIDMSVGRKINAPQSSSPQDRGDKNISQFDPRYKGDGKPTGSGSSSAATQDLVGVNQKENRNRFDENDKRSDSNTEPSPSKVSDGLLETRQDKNISRYDPRYKGDDKFRSSYSESGSPGMSKTRGNLNPKAESFGESSKRQGNRSLALKASFSPLVFGRKVNQEAEEPAENKADTGEHSSQSSVQASTPQEEHQGGPRENEEKNADSPSALDHSDGKDSISPLADTAAEKSPEESVTDKMEDEK